jgi:hypothetical protein
MTATRHPLRITPHLNARTHRFCAYTGPAVIVLLSGAMILLLQFVPPPSPAASAADIARSYQAHVTAIRAGVVIGVIGMTLFIPWGVSIAAWVRRSEVERDFPLLTDVILLCVVAVSALAVLLFLVWGTAAFRPAAYPAGTVRMLNDFGWLLFLVTAPPPSVWGIALGVAILRGDTVYPRWLGYLSFWMALGIMPGMMIVFFKSGPLAFNGVLGFYEPLTTFFVWMLAVTVYTIRPIGSDGQWASEQRLDAGD